MTNCSEVFTMVEKLLKEMTLREKIGQLNRPMLGWRIYRRTGGGFELTAGGSSKTKLAAIIQLV